jgi:peptidyl-prolyl cis-trans isomerase B (cyclophilin B)
LIYLRGGEAVASSKDRERKLARAKIDRQMARRAEKVRIQRQRQSQIGIGLAVLLVIGVGAFTHWYGLVSSTKSSTAANTPTCSWIPSTPASGATGAAATVTGTPPTVGIPVVGTQVMTIALTQGTVTADLDDAAAPCSAESFTFLAAKHFFDNTKCHRLTTGNSSILQCGDPTGTGQGGPSYEFPDENLPLNYAVAPGASPAASGNPPSAVVYPAGTIAMANSGPNTNGSQFFIVYKDSPFPPAYSVIGQITSGLDVVTKIGAAGVAPGGASTSDGAPKDPVTIKTLTVGTNTTAPPVAPSTAPQPSVSPSNS